MSHPCLHLRISGSSLLNDLLDVLTSWGPCRDCPADLTGDGDVGFPDLLVVLTNWS